MIFQWTLMIIYNLFTGEKIGSIGYEGVLAELNVADINKQRMAVSNFDLNDTEFVDFSINGKFTKLNLYPCAWDVFYMATTVDIFKFKSSFSCETHSDAECVKISLKYTYISMLRRFFLDLLRAT